MLTFTNQFYSFIYLLKYWRFYDVIPLDKCVEEILDAILKERMYYFIPQSLAFLCNAAKWFVKTIINKANIISYSNCQKISNLISLSIPDLLDIPHNFIFWLSHKVWSFQKKIIKKK